MAAKVSIRAQPQ
ncbi:putative cinnamyl alcohol dehydrogenase 6 [Zea mays]|uniref:Putative cinnamyl alcohol dehydrogenase 6 n=1 Tax=Zea mays TaxID=4577 RepID=A0A1D6I400_MAIZE|nr:putative cinnamyl alcohol dehydrogenase 6 [Zea mays]ONM54868.1 putative cinnamyl alcohol dehydrogenase 6 [Zea mays]